MNIKKISIFIFALAMLLQVLACSLMTEAPPTLAPSTPLSTITPSQGLIPPTLQVQPFSVTPPPGVVQSTPIPVVRPPSLDQVDANRMMQTIQTMVSFETRHVLSDSTATYGIGAAYNYLYNEFMDIKASSPFPDIRIDVFPHQFSYEWGGQDIVPSNVVMAVTGTDAAAGVVILTAHYDTATQSWFEGNTYQPGADDNASGVAAVLEIARLMVQQRNRATLVFVLFAAEETGRQGSIAFVENYIQPLRIPVVAVINLDMVGVPEGRNGERYDNLIRAFSQGPNENSSSRQIARLAQFATMRYLGDEIKVSVEDRLDRSNRWGDHQSFSDVGYPAVRLIEAADDSTVAHTTRDTIDRIDPAYLRRTTQVTLATIEVLSNGPNAPTLKPLYISVTDPASMTLEWSHNPFCASYIVALRRPESVVYDQFYSANAAVISWGEFKNYEAVTVGCVDAQGRLGRFAPELLIPRPS